MPESQTQRLLMIPSVEELVKEGMGFAIPRTGVYDDQGFDDDFDLAAAFEEVAAYLEDAG